MENAEKKARVWELDAFRGLFIIGMVIVHTIYDLTELFDAGFTPPGLYFFVKQYGSALFIALSGICATFGSHSVKRGLTVIGFGALVSLVMAVLTHFYPDSFGNIYFGILQFLGCCMLLYPLFRKLPVWALSLLAVLSAAAGYFIKDIDAGFFPPLVVLGFSLKNFYPADHFPIFPNIAWFFLGIVLGKTLYKEKRSRLPQKIGETKPVKFLMLCGRYSLWIYVLHQPVVYGVLWVICKACGKI